ncbi:MAG: peptidylprolyl isomerase [Planctomycetota bacterium]|jgi:cyclophilin family peptidyl-prolyl cis-trans isomerase
MNAIAVCLLVLIFLGAAQPAPDGPPQASDPAAAAADSEFDALAGAFGNLYRSLQAKRGVAAEDHDVIRALRDRVVAFNETHPGNARGLALELQLSQWLEDRQRVDELFARLATLTGDVKIGLAWARYYERLRETERVGEIYDRLAGLFPSEPDVLIGQARYLRAGNEYGRAVAILEQLNLDAATHPKAALLLSECLFAQQRYQDAVDVLESIPQETLDTQPAVRASVDQDLPVRREYVGLWDQEQQIRSAEAAAGDLPRVEILTARGRIVVELFENEARNTVANFISLAESGFYDGTTFHRVMPNFMSQGGDPNTKPGATGVPGSGSPGYLIKDEHTLGGARNHFTGSLAMAKTNEPNTAGCQFYITHTAPAHLNGQHTVFGRTVEGLEVARSLEVGDVIETVTVLSKRDHEYVPETLPDPTAIPPVEDLETSLDLSLTPLPETQETSDTAETLESPQPTDPGETEE